jgi:hypothetical protein
MRYFPFAMLLFFLSFFHVIYGREISKNNFSYLANSFKKNKLQDQTNYRGWLIGISGGLMINHVKTNLSDFPYWNFDNAYEAAYPGVDFYYQLSKRVYYFMGLNVAEKGQITRFLYERQVGYFNLTRTYLNVPLGFKVLLFNYSFSPFVEGGIYGSFWMVGRWRISHPKLVQNIFDENYPDNTEFIETKEKYEFRTRKSLSNVRDNRIDLGIIAGAGLQYTFKNRIGIAAGFRYLEGLMPLSFAKKVSDHEYTFNQSYLIYGSFFIPIGLRNSKN